MPKPFISKNNPFGESEVNGEVFEYKYFYPKYWPMWGFLGLSFLVAYLPKLYKILPINSPRRALKYFGKYATRKLRPRKLHVSQYLG